MKPGYFHLSTRVQRMVAAIIMLPLLGSCGPENVEKSVSHYILTGLDGAQSSVQAFRGKLLVLNVWATWCAPCRKEMPSLEQLSKSTAGSHITVIGISTDESLNAAREFVTKYGITFPIFIDTPDNVANMLDVRLYPETLLISPDGKIIKRILGERDWNSPETRQLLEAAYLDYHDKTD